MGLVVLLHVIWAVLGINIVLCTAKRLFWLSLSYHHLATVW